MDRITLINFLIEQRGYKRYLEIGCFADACFSQIQAEAKVGVDPVSGGTVRQTSDAFFEEALAAGTHFDIIFIDGLHQHDQVYRDVENSLACLSEGGVILMHDCLPPDLFHETALCGTVWRAFVQFRKRPELDAIVGDFDYGVGMIRKVSNPSPLALDKSMDELCYDDFVANRESWMRPVGSMVFQILGSEPFWKMPFKGEPSMAVLVIGKSEEELQLFRDKSPHVEEEARVVYVSNPNMRYGGTAAIANPFLEEAAEDVVGVVHADTTFAPGALQIFARTVVDRGCVAGIVGRDTPSPDDAFSGYVWCHGGGGAVSTLDSCSIFFQRSLGFRFDGATFDSFHCVVEDICLQAQLRKIPSVVPAVQAGHVGAGGGGSGGSWNDQFWAYRAKLVAKYPGIVFHTI